MYLANAVAQNSEIRNGRRLRASLKMRIGRKSAIRVEVQSPLLDQSVG